MAGNVRDIFPDRFVPRTISGHMWTVEANDRTRYIYNIIVECLKLFTRDMSQQKLAKPSSKLMLTQFFW